MSETRKRILWIDDEIDLLRSHIVFLETRGYAVTAASGGDEGIRLIRDSDPQFDVVLLDKQMPVKSGSATLAEIKALWPDLPVVILTGYEHEADAIAEKMSCECLTKPVDMSKLLLVCKQIIESGTRASRRLSDRYLRSYTENRALMGGTMGAADWMDVYASLAQWDIEMDGVLSEGVRQMHAGLKSDCGKGFCDFIAENYAEWVRDAANRPLMSADVFDKAVVPELSGGRSVLMVMLNGMRLDQFLAAERQLKRYFSVTRARFVSALPTVSKICAPALAAGGFPAALAEREPRVFDTGGEAGAAAMKKLMRGALERAGMGEAKAHYANINTGRHLKTAVEAVKKARTYGVLAMDVVNKFTKTAGKQPKDPPPDDRALRLLIESWFTGSEVFGAMREVCGGSCTVILTSAHGHITCDRESEVYEAAHIDKSRRCFFGDRASGDDREVFLLENMQSFGLPPEALGAVCLMARENYRFTLPGKRGKHPGPSFQCGGISPEEMIMPLYVCRP